MRYFHVDVMKSLSTVRVGEADVNQLEVAFQPGHPEFAARLDLVVGVENLEVAFGVSQGIVISS